MKILHVTEAYGGGVTSAIKTYVEHSRQYRHFLVAVIRENDRTGEEGSDFFEGVEFCDGKMGLLKSYKKALSVFKPDVVHVHSSIAGFFVRLYPVFEARKTIYTPHAYAFLRNDNKLKLAIYYYIEKILAIKKCTIAACSKHESEVAKELNKGANVIELANVVNNLPDISNKNKINNEIVIGMVGRICEQKGYDYFAQVADQFRTKVKFIWIGDGSQMGRDRLTSAGVFVTGWLPRSVVLKKISELDLLFYTAAWDGFPMSVLEASYYNVPLLLREIEPFTTEDIYTVKTVENAISAINFFIDNDLEMSNKLKAIPSQINEYHSPKRLSHALSELYENLM